MSVYLKTIILFLLLGSSLVSRAQSGVENLMVQKQKILEDIEKSKKKIEAYSDDISSITLKLAAIQRQINLKNELLKKRRSEISINKKIIKSFQNNIDSLDESLTYLKADFKTKANGLYAHTLKNKGKLNFTTLSIDKSLLKKIYVRQYRQMCADQADTIKVELTQLEMAKAKQQIVLDDNKAAAKKLRFEKNKFDSENKKMKSSISNMKSKKTSLKKDLDKYNKDLKTLESAISKAIKKSKKKKIDVTLSDNFAANTGLFSPPLSNAHIISNFGEQPHPIITNVKIFNNGLDIASLNPKVQALFDGIVISIQEIPGSGQAIILQHGAYYTVYSKLVQTHAKIGDRVTTHQHIGNISNLVGENLLHFELWKNQERLDPEQWINF